VHGDGVKSLAVKGPQDAEREIAEPRRLAENGVEYRSEVARRLVDDLQHLGGGSLLLERLARFGDEARIFHRDHRLRREVLQERDLLLGERPHILPPECEGPQELTFLA